MGVAGADNEGVRTVRPRRVLMSLRLAALAGALALGTSAPAGAAEAPASCGLLRPREVSRAFGQPAGKAAPGRAPQVCDWELGATDTRAAGTVHALVTHGGSAKRAYALAEEFHVDDREPLPGLGRKAFFAPTLGTVWVLEDRSTALYVQGLFPRGAEPEAAVLRDALVRLAAAAAARA